MADLMEFRDYRALAQCDLAALRVPLEIELKRFLGTVGGKYGAYKERLIAACLCQGAAKHYLDAKTGVKDIDIWIFFRQHDLVRIPNFRNMRKSVVVALPRFGTMRIDLMKKQIGSRLWMENAESTIANYLRHAKTKTSALLAGKPVIGLFPEELFGHILWEGAG